MKILNSIRPCVDPWAIPLVTDIQLDFVPLITMVWVWLFRQFSIHLTVHFSNICFLSFCMRMLQDTVVKILSNVSQTSTAVPSSIKLVTFL